MAREITDWYDEKQVTTNEFYVLAGPNKNAFQHNIYVAEYGYVTDHILPNEDRSNPEHWDAQFQDSEIFKQAWKPRPGPLELVDNLARQKRRFFRIVNLGAGLGDFTADLARIPNVSVVHVDFSQQANRVAQINIERSGVSERVKIVTAANLVYLQQCIHEGITFDMVFIYGGLAENTPMEQDIEETIRLATDVLTQGGYLWYVGLVQPFLQGEGNRTATDILGEYPAKPGLLREILDQLPNMYLIKENIGPRPDKHPLQPGGDSIDHMHIVQRALMVKKIGGKIPPTPNFDFKNAVDSNWPSTWQELTI